MKPPVTPPAGKVGLSKWLTGHKWEAGLGASGIAVTVFLAYRSRKNAGTSGTSPSTGATAALPTSTYPGGFGGGGGTGDYSDLSGVLSQLSTELGGAGQSAGASSAAPIQLGSGFLPSGVSLESAGNNPGTYTASDTQGNEYLWANPAEAATGTLGPLFVQTAPGTFVQETSQLAGQLAPGTPQYVKQGPS